MSNYLQSILIAQFEAALCMLDECVRRCPPEHFEGKIANDTFRQVAYHTLFYADYYLSPGEAAFSLRELHERGGDERGDGVSPGLSQEETLAYVAICRQKMCEIIADETEESLRQAAGFSRQTFTCGEKHLYNIRHIQHHVGQLSAYLRRYVQATESWWVKRGWR